MLLVCVGGQRAAADDADVRFRVSWGGGAPTTWSGTIRISNGRLGIDKILGVEADSPGVLVATASDAIRIMPRTPRRYDGVDLVVSAPRDALLTVELRPSVDSPVKKYEATLEQLLTAHIVQELDKSGNRLAVQRMPGDMLQLEFGREHVVFAPGEAFRGTLTPSLVQGAANMAVKCSLRLLPLGSDTPAWQVDHDISLDERGSAAAIPMEFALPSQEGVYELVMECSTKRFGTTLVRQKPFAERRVQMLVLSTQPNDGKAKEWSLVGEFDPAHPKLWERMLRVPSMKMLGGFSKGPLGNEPTKTRSELGITWSTLQPSGWQAYPLPVTTVGKPHLLEIEFPSDSPQALAMSLIEPNAAGRIAPLGLDSGIDVERPAAGRTPKVLTHRVVFWPRTNSPLVLLANRRDDAPAIFGKIRVLEGGEALFNSLPKASQTSAEPGRLLAAYFDKPLFPENFSVAESLDPHTGRVVDDWQVYLQGTTRLAEYVKYSGQNAAMVSVLCEGSTLYPSQLLASTPKYDSGPFAEAAIDPLRKDVLEAMLRVFDREHLALIPAIQFSSPLPELEVLKITLADEEARGIDLEAADGRRWTELYPPRRGSAAHYNLLDRRVQQAMRHVVLEIAERYGTHESLRGISLQLSAESFAQLPDDACALDAPTVARFASDVDLQFPETTSNAERWNWIRKNARAQWISWRASEVAAFYRTLRTDLQGIRPDLQLLLTAVEPLQGANQRSPTRPTLPSADRSVEELQRLGLDLGELQAIPGLMFARPTYVEMAALPDVGGIRSELNNSQALDRQTRNFASAAVLNLAEPIPLRLEAFDKVSPIGASNTHTLLLSHLAPVGPEARRRHVQAIARCDAQLILDGGQMLLLGQESETRDLFATLRGLPAAAFNDIAPSNDQRTQPLVLRSFTDKSGTWLYVVNPSPWSAVADIDIAAAGSSASVAAERVGEPGRRVELWRQGHTMRWNARLEPWDMAAIRLKQTAKVESWKATLDSGVEIALREDIRGLRLRANALRAPQSLPVLPNDSFEASSADAMQKVPHWTVAEGAGIAASIDRGSGKSGAASLHLHSGFPLNQPPRVTWVRSESIPIPRTGRLAVAAWLKTASADRQPTLRIAIEGKLHGQTYYRRANIGASEDGRTTQPLQQEWSPFLFAIDDLPTTGLTDLQIGFDLMGEGEIWIDDVQLFDLWFQDIERDSLLKSIAIADLQVQEGRVGDAQRFLQSYWPQFLRNHVPLPDDRMATLPVPSINRASEPPAASKSSGMLDGMRRWMPRMPFQK